MWLNRGVSFHDDRFRQPDRADAQWLADAHVALDTLVATAYGWDTGILEDDALRELLAYNHASGRTILGLNREE